MKSRSAPAGESHHPLAFIPRNPRGTPPFLLSALVCCLLCASQFQARAQIPAFPGALGFGANATGGRAGTVYHVTTLADSGAGSFRDAVSHSGRMVVFDVGGYISLASAVPVQGNITIAGQTAPGGGIGFRGGEVSFASRNNIICRYIRVLPGSETASWQDDALSLYRSTNVICDHISLEFGPYNNIDGVSDDWQNYPVTAITFQNCIIADPSNYVASDSHAGQQFGAHTECVNGTWSWFYNIFANSHNRNPLAKINTVFVNNVEYNNSAGYTTHTSTPFTHDLVNNYFIAGPGSSSTDFPWYQVDNNQSIYYTGNLYDSNSDGALNGSITTPDWYQGGNGGTVLLAPWSSLTTNVPTYSPAAAYRIALSQAGALPRSQVDDLVVSQMKTLGNGPTGTGAGTAGPDGGFYSSQTATGLGNNGYGVINGGIPALDSDLDGMPDYWERTVGLDPNVNDAMTIAADGYANIEHYLNWLADPHAVTATNTAVEVDLRTYTSGFTNAAPVYSVNNASNGVVTLNGDGHTAHFAPANNYFGLGSFQFGVRASDGTGYTNTLSVAIVPQSQSQTQPSYLTWRGDGLTNLWAVGSGADWFDGTNLVTFNAGDTVTFDDTGSNTPAINLTGALSAGIVYVLAAREYTFGGPGFLAGSTAVFKTGSGQLNLNTTNTYAGGTVINEGVVQVGDGVSFNGSLSGNITNNDTLIFNNPGPASASANIGGTGILIKSGGGALTLNGTQTYTNLTIINAGSLQFSGTLPHSDIANNGSLVFAPSSPQLCNNNLSGSGTLTVNASSALVLSNANTYTGGTTNIAGTLALANNSAAGTGLVSYSGGSVAVWGGVVITNDFSIPGSATTDLCMQATNGTGVWAGNIINLGSNAQWRPGADTGGTFVFTGNALQGSANFIIPRGSVQLASNAVVSATGPATALGRDSGGNNRSANITIKDNAAVTLGACSMGGGKSGGSVTVTVQNNTALSLGANNFDLHNVTRSTAVTTLRLNGGTTTAGGFTKSQTYTNVINFNGGNLVAGVNNASFLPAFANQTAIVQAGGARIGDGGFAITVAQPLIHDATLGATLDGGLTKLGSGTLTLSGVNTFTGPTTISAGSLALSGSGSVANSTAINVAAGALFDASGTTGGGFTASSGCTVMGNGSLKGNFTIGSGAILAPGSNSIGRLTFSNNCFFAAGSTSLLELSKSPATNDLVRVLGTLTLGGALFVTNIGSSALAPGDTFKLFDAANYTSYFSSVVLPALGGGLAWNTNALATTGTLTVVASAQPVIANCGMAGTHFVFGGGGGATNGNYYVLTSTNVTLPLVQWARVATNQFDANGQFRVTNAVATNQFQEFFRLKLP